jgi:hypothetical protein
VRPNGSGDVASDAAHTPLPELPRIADDIHALNDKRAFLRHYAERIVFDRAKHCLGSPWLDGATTGTLPFRIQGKIGKGSA